MNKKMMEFIDKEIKNSKSIKEYTELSKEEIKKLPVEERERISSLLGKAVGKSFGIYVDYLLKNPELIKEFKKQRRKENIILTVEILFILLVVIYFVIKKIF